MINSKGKSPKRLSRLIVSCKAVPSGKAVVSNTQKRQAEVLARFKIDYPKYASKITTFAQIEVLVNKSSSFQAWYVGLKQERTLLASIPQTLEELDVPSSEWKDIQQSFSDFKSSQREMDRRIEGIAKEAKDKIQAVNKEKEDLFATIEPLVVIANLSFEHLSEDKQIELSIMDAKKREEKESEELKLLRKRYYINYKSGKFENPFINVEK